MGKYFGCLRSVCILGQVPRSDMSSYWLIILHSRILEALLFLIKVPTRGPFSAINPLDKLWWSSGEGEAMRTKVSKPRVLPNQHAVDLQVVMVTHCSTVSAHPVSLPCEEESPKWHSHLILPSVEPLSDLPLEQQVGLLLQVPNRYMLDETRTMWMQLKPTERINET